MGAFYNSICLPGAKVTEAWESLRRWLALRGFERVPESTLFDLDGELERSAWLIANDRWTVVVFSKYEEERRLIRELQTWSETVVYVWVQDSDVWGYDLFDSRGFAGSFASDPRAYHSFRDEPFPSEQRPTAKAEEICRRLDLAGREKALRELERRSARFEEDVCLDFCRLLGAEAAMVSYDDLERGLTVGLEGWVVEHFLFRHRDADGGGDRLALHQFSFSDSEGGATGIGLRSAAELIPSLPQEMAQVRERSRTRHGLLRPMVWLARGWRRLMGERASPLALPPGGEGIRGGEGGTLGEDRRLVSRRHGLAIELPEGAEPIPVSGKPASVFTFRLGDTVVTCTSRRLEKVAEVLQRPNRSEVLEDERYHVGPFAARHVLFQLPPLYLADRPEPSYLGLHVVETPRALYVFLYRSAAPPPIELQQGIRRVVDSFRGIDPPVGVSESETPHNIQGVGQGR